MKYQTLILTLTLSALLGAPAPALAKSADQAQAFETLEPVKSRRLTTLEVAPDARFDGYEAVVLEPTSIEFSPNWLRQQQRSGVFLKESDIDRIRGRLAEQADAFFAAYFIDQGYRIAEAGDADALRVSPQLVDVDINVPDAGQNRYRDVVGTYGFVTLDVAFADAGSEQVLAHVRDRKTPRAQPARLRTVSNNERDLRRLLEEWSEALSAELPLPVVASGS